MKRALVVALLLVAAAQGQAYDGLQGDYAPAQTSRWGSGYNTFPSKYYGVRVGLNLTHVASDSYYHSCGRRTLMDVGVVFGKALTSATPLYFETGLAYVAKGGRKGYEEDDLLSGVDDRRYGADYRKADYNLDYLEIPLLLKYMITTSGSLAFHITFGGYLAFGVSGNIKHYAWDTDNTDNWQHGAFGGGDTRFRRFDGGLKFGCAVSYSFLYLEFSYDLGLSNINHDTFTAAHNRNAIFNIGVNF